MDSNWGILVLIGAILFFPVMMTLMVFVTDAAEKRRERMREPKWWEHMEYWDEYGSDPMSRVAYRIYVPNEANAVTDMPVVDLSQYLLASDYEILTSTTNPLMACQAAANEFLAKSHKQDHTDGTLVEILNHCFQLLNGNWREVTIAELVS